MNDDERAELKRLMGDKAFLAFLYRMIRSAGVLSVAPVGGRSLEFIEGRRSLALDILREVDSVQDRQSPDGLPILGSIQILVSVAQSATKEKDLGRKRSIYRDLDGDASDE